MFNIKSHQEIANQNHNEKPFTCSYSYKKKMDNSRDWRIWKNLETSYIAGGSVKWSAVLENSLEVPREVNQLYNPAIPLLSIYTQEK